MNHLINEYMPRWDVRSQHRLTVHAGPAATYSALRTANLGAHPIVLSLLALRALPSALASGRIRELWHRGSQAITLAEFERLGFAVIAEKPPQELLIGLEGPFWKPGGDLRPVSAATFSLAVPHGVARGTWSFSVRALGAAGSELTTETRVLAGDRVSRWQFRLYWLLVGWASGLIRRFMLRSIKAEAERGGTQTAE